jgi:hypothetical protein
MTEQNNNIELTVNDLAVLRQAVGIAIKRGAYEPNQVSAVGNVYDKLDGFLEAVAANQEAAQAEASAQEAPAEEAGE